MTKSRPCVSVVTSTAVKSSLECSRARIVARHCTHPGLVYTVMCAAPLAWSKGVIANPKPSVAELFPLFRCDAPRELCAHDWRGAPPGLLGARRARGHQ